MKKVLHETCTYFRIQIPQTKNSPVLHFIPSPGLVNSLLSLRNKTLFIMSVITLLDELKLLPLHIVDIDFIHMYRICIEYLNNMKIITCSWCRFKVFGGTLGVFHELSSVFSLSDVEC